MPELVKGPIYGYKATDENMRCRGFQFQLGEWYEHTGELSLCESGFHFCEFMSGPWCYYYKGRLFKVEAMDVILSIGPGADLKHVCKKIRLVEEIKIAGYGNTGARNSGDGNTGDRNTGNRNAGYGNTGYGNAGDGNTGYGNTGDRNTGNGNTGDGNTGNRNAGDGNTGYGNAGDGNTGNGNTGDGNTGDGNCCNDHPGSLCMVDPPFYLFDLPADRSKANFTLIIALTEKLMRDEEFDCTFFLGIENATTDRIRKLHDAHKAARAKRKA